jgi:hypothetical protein
MRAAVMARFPLFGLLACSALVGCSYTHHSGVQANGANDQLQFSRYESSLTTPLAVGYALDIAVSRFSASDVDCKGLGLYKNSAPSGGLHIQGGSLPDPDHCDAQRADVVSFVSATCDDDLCAIVSDPSHPRSVALKVTGKRAGTTRLVVSLKSGDTVFEDYVTLHFEAPARIRVAMEPRDTAAAMLPALPGIEVSAPRATVVDANDEELEIDRSLLAFAAEGDAYQPDVELDSRLVAKKPGHTTLRFTYEALPARSIDLEVVDPADARALLIYAPVPVAKHPYATVDPADLTADPGIVSGRVTSVSVPAGTAATFPSRVTLVDGRTALAPLTTVELAPVGFCYASAALFEPGSLDVGGEKVGSGTVTLRATAKATLTVPVIVPATGAR